MNWNEGAHITQKSSVHLKIICVNRMTWSKFQTKNLQILDTAVQNVVVTVTLRRGLVHPWTKIPNLDKIF